MKRFFPVAVISCLLAACGGSSDSPSVVSSNDSAAPAGTTTTPTTTTTAPAPAPNAAPDPSPNAAAILAAGYADVQTDCSIDTPMRWSRPATIGYNGGVLRVAPNGEPERSIVLDTASARVDTAGGSTTARAPTAQGIDAWITIDTSGALTGAGTAGSTPATSVRCGSARDGVAVAAEETISLSCTRTDSTTPGGPTTSPTEPLVFRADFANFPWRYMATTDPSISDDEVGRLVGGSGAVVTRDASTDGRLHYSVAIGNRGIGEDAAYYELIDGRLVAMSQGNRRVLRECRL